MENNFNQAFFFTLQWEGNIVDHPLDPGGETIYGISKKYFPQENGEILSLYKNNKKELALKKAKEFYKKRFWDACQCDTFKYPMDIFIFDTAVHCGITYAKQNSGVDIYTMIIKRLKRYTELCKKNPNLKTFFLGWCNRVINFYEKYC